MGRKINSYLSSGVRGQLSIENFDLQHKLNEQVVAGDLVLKHRDKDFLDYISKRSDRDINGILDVVGHGTTTNMEVLINGKILKIDHRLLAKMLKHSSNFGFLKGIRLLSCNTGKDPYGFAQNLANKLGIPVYAPNTYYFSYSNGIHFTANMNSNGKPILSKLGEMIKFIPGGNKK